MVARTVNDPRAANTRLVIQAAAPTQNELVATYEAVYGTTVPCVTVTNEELEAELKGGDACCLPSWAASDAIWQMQAQD